MQEHMHLTHIHNALEFADLLREGARYEIEFKGDAVSPLAQSGCRLFYGSATIDRLLLVPHKRQLCGADRGRAESYRRCRRRGADAECSEQLRMHLDHRVNSAPGWLVGGKL